MKIALAVNSVVSDRAENLANIIRLTQEAAVRGARLVLFPEAAPTGLVINDDPKHDLPLGGDDPRPDDPKTPPVIQRKSHLDRCRVS